MTKPLRHWEIGPGRAARMPPPYDLHRTMLDVQLDERLELLAAAKDYRNSNLTPVDIRMSSQLRKNVARRLFASKDVGNTNDRR